MNYKNIIPQNYPLVHDLDFTKLSNDEWFQHHIKMHLRYTISHECRCGTETRTSDPNKILTIEDYQKVIIKLLSDVQRLFGWLFMSIEHNDISVKHIIFPEKFKINMNEHINDNRKNLWGASFETTLQKDLNEMYAMGGSRNDYSTISRIKW